MGMLECCWRRFELGGGCEFEGRAHRVEVGNHEYNVVAFVMDRRVYVVVDRMKGAGRDVTVFETMDVDGYLVVVKKSGTDHMHG